MKLCDKIQSIERQTIKFHQNCYYQNQVTKKLLKRKMFSQIVFQKPLINALLNHL